MNKEQKLHSRYHFVYGRCIRCDSGAVPNSVSLTHHVDDKTAIECKNVGDMAYFIRYKSVFSLLTKKESEPPNEGLIKHYLTNDWDEKCIQLQNYMYLNGVFNWVSGINYIDVADKLAKNSDN